MLLRTQKQDGVLQVHFDDAKSKNALSLNAARELRDIISKPDFDALVLTAEGRVFCSGGNLSDYASMTTAEQGRAVNDEIRDVLHELATLNRPTVAVINGDVFGGGVELVSCFDVVYSAPHVMFALWQRKIGLSFGWGGGARLEKRLGPSRLRSLSLSTNSVTAREALNIGLIDHVTQDVQLVTEAFRVAKALTALPSEPVTTFKNFVSIDEAKRFNQLWHNDSHKKVLASRLK